MTYRQARWAREGCLEPLVFELSKAGRMGASLPRAPARVKIPEKLTRTSLELPELSEPQVVRHYTRLSQMNYGVDSGFYPLGSCTMKYNPKVCDELVNLDGAAHIHPYQAEETVQGALELMYRLERHLAEIAGVSRVCLHPSAGAHGELLGMLLVRAYHKSTGSKRTEVIVPDSAHGTNFASAAMAGFNVVVVPSNNRGRVDLGALREAVSNRTAALMLTNPNTLGLFEDEILEIAEAIHKVGGLLYYDGANLNGILGKARPGDMGFDIVHFNLHKTFSTPHGGGGPGAGPIGVVRKLEKFLPVPVIEYDRRRKRYYLDYNRPNSIGKIKSFYGNFGVLVKAYAYILLMGAEGLEEVSEAAVLNANYIMRKLLKVEGYELKFDTSGPCKHEVVFSAEPLKKKYGVRAHFVAKRLLDFGMHAPTYYFPPIVPEALMIEPTETETKEELDQFIEALKQIAEEARSDPEKLQAAPTATAIARLDEVKASREPILSWRMYRKLAKK
ncbi:MAG: aminomethyl-transferring glycine dehydrogenase subunit GcvPB [Candidatus Hodarchaeaceae archaeon]|nr:aminomethyl-transferring glycine dehydrogenase subunit GcvPB [Candidatus Hodarchaeaceae archaeon]